MFAYGLSSLTWYICRYAVHFWWYVSWYVCLWFMHMKRHRCWYALHLWWYVSWYVCLWWHAVELKNWGYDSSSYKKKFWKWWGAESPANTIKSVLWTPSSWHFVAIFKVVMITKHCEGWKIHCTLLLKMLISSGFSSPRGTMFFTCFHRTCWLCNKQFMHWRDQCLTLFRLPTSVSNLYLYEPVAATVHTCPHKIINPQLDCKCETLYVALFVIYTWHKHHVQCNIPISPNH